MFQRWFDPATEVVVLRVLAGPLRGMVTVLQEGVNRIGRDSACTVAIPDATVSRVHCEVVVSEHRVGVRDRTSLHGIHLNGRPVVESEVRAGDVIQLGEVSLIVETRRQPGESLKPVIASRPSTKRATALVPDDGQKRVFTQPVPALVQRCRGRLGAEANEWMHSSPIEPVNPRAATVRQLVPMSRFDPDRTERFEDQTEPIARREAGGMRPGALDQRASAAATLPPVWEAGTGALFLRVIDGEPVGAIFFLRPGLSILGADPSCDIRVPNPDLRSFECYFAIDRREVVVGSVMGKRLHVNGARTTEQVLLPRDRIEVGGVTFLIDRRSDESPENQRLWQALHGWIPVAP